MPMPEYQLTIQNLMAGIHEVELYNNENHENSGTVGPD